MPFLPIIVQSILCTVIHTCIHELWLSRYSDNGYLFQTRGTQSYFLFITDKAYILILNDGGSQLNRKQCSAGIFSMSTDQHFQTIM